MCMGIVMAHHRLCDIKSRIIKRTELKSTVLLRFIFCINTFWYLDTFFRIILVQINPKIFKISNDISDFGFNSVFIGSDKQTFCSYKSDYFLIHLFKHMTVLVEKYDI